jgi:hypothetical protein
MAVQLVEIYQDKVAPFQKIATKQSTAYSLREIYVNPEYVVMLRPSVRMNNEVKKDTTSLPEGLHSEQQYTTIYMNRGQSGTEITVVGAPEHIEEKLRRAKRELLKG